MTKHVRTIPFGSPEHETRSTHAVDFASYGAFIKYGDGSRYVVQEVAQKNKRKLVQVFDTWHPDAPLSYADYFTSDGRTPGDSVLLWKGRSVRNN